MEINKDKLNLLKSTHEGELTIGERVLPVAVLEDGTRIIARNAIFRAFGRTKRGRSKLESRAPNLPSFFDAKNLIPYIDDNLREALTPVSYTNKRGRVTKGYKAELIPLMCDAYLAARLDGALTSSQVPLAAASEILVRSLSKLGIVALIDEATGYQADRQKDELQRILAAYISAELLPWQKRFPNEFYQQICRLKEWNFDPILHRRPQIIGKITNDIVYNLLPKGVLEELRRLNPPNESGNRTYKHHQFLTLDIGNPNLEKHLAQLIILMRISKTWDDFEEKLCEAFPTYGSLQPSLFSDDDLADEHKFNRAIIKASHPTRSN